MHFPPFLKILALPLSMYREQAKTGKNIATIVVIYLKYLYLTPSIGELWDRMYFVFEEALLGHLSRKAKKQ